MNNNAFAYKCGALTTITLFLLVALMLYPPIETPARYLVMADQRSWFGIPNAWNVLSNIAFIIVGAMAFTMLSWERIKEKLFYIIFFIAVFLVGFGSAFYHWSPNNFALMWDRMPIAIAMMAFTSAMISERISAPFAKFMLWPFLLLALFSVVYWYITIEQGAEDLRVYTFILVFLPIILIPFILIFFKSLYTASKYLWFALISFLIARICEGYDAAIYEHLGHIISGHTLKHLLLAFSCLLVYCYLRKRKING